MLYAALLCSVIHAADQSALQAGPKEVATRQLEAGTKSTPQDAQGYLDQGVAYMRARDYGSAIPPLKKALELNPDLAAAHQPLGYSLLAQGYATEAIAQFDVIQDKAGLGIAQLQTGDLSDAVQNLQSAVAARPDDPDLVYALLAPAGCCPNNFTIRCWLLYSWFGEGRPSLWRAITPPSVKRRRRKPII